MVRGSLDRNTMQCDDQLGTTTITAARGEGRKTEMAKLLRDVLQVSK